MRIQKSQRFLANASAFPADGFSCESKAKGIIKGLGFRDEDMAREVFYFSGGEKTRVSLARLLVREPGLLLQPWPVPFAPFDLE